MIFSEYFHLIFIYIYFKKLGGAFSKILNVKIRCDIEVQVSSHFAIRNKAVNAIPTSSLVPGDIWMVVDRYIR